MSESTSTRDRLPHTATVSSALPPLPHCPKVLESAASASRRAPPRQGRLADSGPEALGPHVCHQQNTISKDEEFSTDVSCHLQGSLICLMHGPVGNRAHLVRYSIKTSNEQMVGTNLQTNPKRNKSYKWHNGRNMDRDSSNTFLVSNQ